MRATRSGRVAVHLDGAFSCTVSESLIAHLHLHAGRDLTSGEVERLRREAAVDAALYAAHRLLSQRARCRSELATRLRAKGHTRPAVDEAIARLTANGLLDDAEFARAFVHDRTRLSGWGPERIAHELARLGVDQGTSASALANMLTEGDDLTRAHAALARRGHAQPPLDAAKRRAFSYLRRRGFGASVAYEAVAHWLAETEARPVDLEGRADAD